MWGLVRDKWRSAQLRARYQRLVQERVLELIEARGPEPVAPDPGRWSLLGGTDRSPSAPQRAEMRTQARQLVQSNPYARNLLRLLEVYVAGPGMEVTAVAVDADAEEQALAKTCDRLWREFLAANRRHFSFVETARRTWRDGEAFLRLFPDRPWPPTVRYVDPEAIGPTADDPESEGILTEPDDVETVVAYLMLDPVTGELIDQIPAQELLHVRMHADSNERRGVTLFAAVLDSLANFDKWLDTELQARKLQSSIVLWRKVQGSPSQISASVDAAASSVAADPFGSVRKERYRPGTILTTSHSTDLEFLHPNTNFGDAVPLGRLVLLGIAAGAGVPEFMLSSDASNANFASTMVAEGPAVKLFESEQRFFANELEPLWRWVLEQAAEHGLLPGDVTRRVTPRWTFPPLVNRDRPQERLADAKLVELGILSRAEVARRDGVDPTVMTEERTREADGRLTTSGS
jgi:capsid protein